MNAATRTPGRKTRPTVPPMERRQWFVRRLNEEQPQVRRSTRCRSKRVLFDPSNSSPTTVSAVEKTGKVRDEDDTESDTETEDESEDEDEEDSDYSIELGSQDTDDEDEVDEVDGFLIVSSRQPHNL